MPTLKKRINLTLGDDLFAIIETLANKKKMSLSEEVKDLVLLALEDQEELALSKISELRLQEGLEVISHEDAWS